MKRTLLLLTVISFCALTIVALYQTSVEPQASAQRVERSIGSTKRDSAETDKSLAREIGAVTNRSAAGLKEIATADGVKVDLEGRFQNVMLARTNEDGSEPVDACVTSLGEANSFFGRDLETGERIPRTEVESSSSDHPMTEDEIRFYKKMIDDARAKLAAHPEAAAFTIVNNDGAGEGFNDPLAPVVPNEGGNPGATRGAQRLNVFQAAGAIWGAFLDNNVTTTVGATFDPLACSSGSAVLGSAGAAWVNRDFAAAPFSGTWYHGALVNKLTGTDGSGNEINAQFNSNLDNGCFSGSSRFYYGLDGSNPAGTTNLLVVVLHELGHGLGFSSFANGSTGALFNSFPDTYTRFTFDTTVGLYWYQMSNAQRQASAINNGNVYWDGPNVKIASSFLTAGRDAATGRVLLYTPTTFSSGSSVSHFSTTATPNLLMEPNINSGLAITGDLARQQMRDIGWYRDSTTDLSADTVSNVLPNGGTALIGSNKTITWTNNGGFNRNVRIELSTDGGATYPTVIAADTPNTGSFSWTVPNSPSSTARIRVREVDFVAPSGSSSGNFTISLTPLAGGAAVSGRVLDQAGRGVSRATVVLVNVDGVQRSAITNSFGYFVFDDVAVGASYLVNVRHKQYRFEQRVIDLTDNFSDLNFVATY